MGTRKIGATLVALTLLTGAAMVIGGPAAEAKKKKKKKPPALVQVDQKFFLRSTGCTAADVNSDYLSLTDADEDIQCFYTGSGIRNEIGNTTGTVGANGSNAVSDRKTATRHWDATDGVPLVLDGTKPITATIWTSGGSCAVGGVPCSPAGATLGEVILDITVVGTASGNEVELGTFTDTFQTVPGNVHQTDVEIALDPSVNGLTFDTIDFQTWIHGKSVGHGVINTNAETSSFVSVPALVPAS